MMAEILENPRKRRRSRRKVSGYRRKSRRKLSAVGRTRTRRRRRRISLATVAAPNPRRRRRSRRRRISAIGVVANPRRRRRSRRVRGAIGRRRRLSTVAVGRTRRRMGGAFIPAQGVAVQALYGLGGITISAKGGAHINRILSNYAGPLCGYGTLTEYLSSFLAIGLGVKLLESFSGANRPNIDAFQAGGLAHIGIRALGSFIGISITPVSGSLPFLSGYETLGNARRVVELPPVAVSTSPTSVSGYETLGGLEEDVVPYSSYS